MCNVNDFYNMELYSRGNIYYILIVEVNLQYYALFYYRASYALRRICHGRLTVCLSVRPSVRHKSVFY